MPGHKNQKWQYEFEKTLPAGKKNQLHSPRFPGDIAIIL